MADTCEHPTIEPERILAALKLAPDPTQRRALLREFRMALERAEPLVNAALSTALLGGPQSPPASPALQPR